MKKKLTNKKNDGIIDKEHYFVGKQALFVFSNGTKGGKIMRKFSKVVSTVLAATMIVSALAGCGSKGNSGSTGDKFLIGGIGPLTGAAASYGISVKQGAQVAIDEINAAGGVKVGDKTVQLEMTFADDEATEDKAIQAYNTVMDAGAQAILGAVTSGASIAIGDSTAADGILQITPSGSAQDCTKNDNAFRICFTDPLQGVTMANFMADELGYTKVAVIYNNSDEYSTGIKDAFAEEFQAKGGTVVAAEAFATGDVDFNTQLTKIKNSDAEAIFVPAYYQDATYITKQAAGLGMSLPFLGSDGWDGILSTATDLSTVEGAIFLSPFFAADPDELVVKFVTAYEAAYKSTPDQFAADGYDAIYTMKAAMEKAGTTDSAALISAMTEITVNGLTGSNVTFTKDGEPNKAAKFIQIKDGAYTAR